MTNTNTAADLAADRREEFPLGASITMADLADDGIGLAHRLREEEPVSWCADAGVWLVAGRELVEEVTRDQTRFTPQSDRNSNRQVLGQTMLTTDGPEHEAERRPFDPALRADHVSAYTDIIDSRIEALLDEIGPSGHAELMDDFGVPLGLDIVSDVLGFGFPDRGLVRSLVDQLTDGFRLTTSVESRAHTHRVRQEFGAEVTKTLAIARTEAPESVLGTVAREYGDQLSDELIVNNTINLIFGGAETTATLFGTSLWTILSHPDALAEIQSNHDLVLPAIDEAIRLHPAFGLVFRFAKEDTTLGGVPIAAGDPLIPLLISANRDPAMFENPDAFDIHRRNARQNISFGRGLHFCIGQNLARLVASLAISACLTRLPALRLDPERLSEPTGIEFHRLPRFDVIWDV